MLSINPHTFGQRQPRPGLGSHWSGHGKIGAIPGQSLAQSGQGHICGGFSPGLLHARRSCPRRKKTGQRHLKLVDMAACQTTAVRGRTGRRPHSNLRWAPLHAGRGAMEGSRSSLTSTRRRWSRWAPRWIRRGRVAGPRRAGGASCADVVCSGDRRRGPGRWASGWVYIIDPNRSIIVGTSMKSAKSADKQGFSSALTTGACCRRQVAPPRAVTPLAQPPPTSAATPSTSPCRSRISSASTKRPPSHGLQTWSL